MKLRYPNFFLLVLKESQEILGSLSDWARLSAAIGGVAGTATKVHILVCRTLGHIESAPACALGGFEEGMKKLDFDARMT